MALCLPLLLGSQCKLPLTYAWSGPYMGFTCVSTFGLVLLLPRMNLVQAAQSSGHGNPIQGPSPLQEESDEQEWGVACGWSTGVHEVATLFFFHEYGRRVGMVPRSSLKEGKNRQMVEKGTKTPKPTQNQHPSPQAETPPSCSLSSTLGETCETETSGN